MQPQYPDLLQSFVEGGWAMFAIFALGVIGIGAGIRFVWKGEHQLVNFLRYEVGALLLAGLFGFVNGMLRVLWHVTERTPEGERLVTLMIGTREAANNLSSSLLFATLTWTLLAVGYRRFPLPNPASLR